MSTATKLEGFNEADHPRVPAGSPDGGEFGAGGGRSGSVSGDKTGAAGVAANGGDAKKAHELLIGSGARQIVAKQLAKGETQTATVAAIAKTSQAAYKEDTVTLYRGITGTQARDIIEAQKTGQPVHVKMDTTTSFTDSKNIASQFAREGSTRRAASPHAVVVTMTVPRQSIVASHRAFSELSKEREVIVATHGGYTLNAGDIEVVGH